MIASLLLLFSMIVFGVVGNGKVIQLIASNSLMQTMGNAFVFSMALSDLCICLFYMPVSFITLITKQWPFGETSTYVVAFYGEFFYRASALTLPAIVYEKHLYVVRRHFTSLSRRGAVAMFTVIWIVAAIFSLPLHPRIPVCKEAIGNCFLQMSPTASNTSIIVFNCFEGILFKFLPSTLILISIVEVGKHVLAVRSKSAGRSTHRAYDIKFLRQESDEYTAFTTLIVTMTFIILCMPFIILQSVLLFGYCIPDDWQKVTVWLLFLNAAVRPMVYGLRNQRSRSYLKRQYARIRRILYSRFFYISPQKRRRNAYVVPMSAAENLIPPNATLVTRLQVQEVQPQNSSPLFTRRRIQVTSKRDKNELPFLDLSSPAYVISSDVQLQDLELPRRYRVHGLPMVE